jgi:glycosyltransferase involved in cell wall biosynthesis
MSFTIVQVAFPFAPVGPDAVGGAEQVLTTLEAGLTALGHRCITVARADSRSTGALVGTAAPDAARDDETWAEVHRRHRASLAEALRHGADLVHMHGIDFHAYLPPPGVPVLATLHLPPDWYPARVLRPTRPDTWLNPVSRSQAAACPVHAGMLPPVPNGVPVAALAAPVTRRDFALALGRVCPEKNLHAALEAGTRAGLPVLVGGELFPYPEHQRYWREEMAPRLGMPGTRHRFLGPVGFARKRRLLSAARCLVSASLAPETSSLVAMEALACGTPVVAFPSGALAEIVEHGVTGFLVRDVAAMAEAIRAAPSLDPEACRAAARRRFSAEAMVARYLDLYRRLIAGEARRCA